MKIEALVWKLLLSIVILTWASDLPATTNTVSFGSFFFNPNNLTINTGDTVVWQGDSQFPSHTVTGSGADPICGSGTVVSCSHTFNTPGTYPYACILPGHASFGMTGVVTVVSTTNLPPTVTIASPGNGAVFAEPADVTIQASASDADGSVANVEFFANANLLGEATAIPYSIVASNLSAGSYALTSIASDNGGLTSTSAPVTISVVTPVAVTLSSPVQTNGRFEFSYTANAGLRYSIENSSNLVDWIALATNTASGGTELYGEVFDINSLRFYRVGRLPNP